MDTLPNAGKLCTALCLRQDLKCDEPLVRAAMGNWTKMGVHSCTEEPGACGVGPDPNPIASPALTSRYGPCTSPNPNAKTPTNLSPNPNPKPSPKPITPTPALTLTLGGNEAGHEGVCAFRFLIDNYQRPWRGVYFTHGDVPLLKHGGQYRRMVTLTLTLTLVLTL